MSLDWKIFLIVLCVLILIPYVYYFLYYYIKKGVRIKKKEGKYKLRPLFLRLFIDLPKIFVYDFMTRDPDAFPDYGVHIIAGKQGCGKTLTMTYLLREYQKKYPKLKVKSNYCYSNEDYPIMHWKDIIDSDNGIYGEVDAIDELQNWFSSMQSKDFPPEMLQEVTQQRKQRKIILGTSQVFNRLSKQLREQTYLLYEPHTFLGCFTLVVKFEPVIKADSATTTEKKFRGCFCFVHTQELRDSYDTYKKIQRIAEEGFVPNPLTSSDNSSSVVVNFPQLDNKKVKKK